jgi:hypothetical protein
MRAATHHVVLAAAALAWIAGCIDPGAPCGTGYCVLDQQCIEKRFCIDPIQRTTCRGLADRDECVIDNNTNGACRSGICVPTTCGDNVVEGAEECDGLTFSSASCKELGEGFHEAGTLRCRADCTVERALCGPRCGDGMAQATFEQCDGDLADVTCESVGFQGGDISCGADCKFDTSRCRGECGDSMRTGAEVCDGVEFGNQTCITQGFYSGQLRCSADCTAIDLSECAGACGDGVVNGGELCDGTALAGRTCRSYGWYGGTLRCGDNCLSVNVAGCEGYCGDGILNGTELCDGLDHDDISCASLGAMAGAVGCDSHCQPTTDTCYWGKPRTVLQTRTQGLMSVWASSPVDVWASSKDDDLVHFDGNQWRRVDIGLESPVVRFWTSADDQLWAQTAGGQLALLDETHWTILHRDVGAHVAATSVSNIWHADSGSTEALHFDGATWTPVEVGSPITAVFSLHDGAAWFATQDDMLVHISASGRTVHGFESSFVQCIWGNDDDDVYASIRHRKEPGSSVVHFDGSNWTYQRLGSLDAEFICGWSTSDGGMWTVLFDVSGHRPIWSKGGEHWPAPVGQFSETGTWVSGGALWSYTGSEIVRLDGPGWRHQTSYDLTIESLFPTGAFSAWIGTLRGYWRIWPRSVHTWLDVPVKAIWASDTVAYLGTSEGVLQQYPNGTSSWVDGTSEISALWGTRDDNVWAVSGGSMVHYDGTAWSSPAVPPTALASANITGTSESNLWAAVDGEVWHWTGSQWTELDLLPDGTSGRARRVLTTATDDLWLFDAVGNSFRYDGETTTHHPGSWADPVEWAWSASPRSIWAVTTGRQLHHFDGVIWSAVNTADAVRPDIVAGSGDFLWIAGDLSGRAYTWPLSGWSKDEGACSDVLRTYCNVTIQGHTAQTVDGPADCNAVVHAGGELHYKIEVPVRGQLTAEVRSRYDVDLSIVRARSRGGCDVASCVGTPISDSKVVLDVEQGQTYFLVVGARDEAAPFTLDVDCSKE